MSVVGGCGCGKATQPFQKALETSKDRIWAGFDICVSTGLALDGNGGRHKEHLTPRKENHPFVLPNIFLMSVDIKICGLLNFKRMFWCALAQAPRTCRFYLCHCSSHLSLAKPALNTTASPSRRAIHRKS